MKNVHFAIPEIYGETLSYYELLRKLVNKTNELIENYNTIPDQIAEEVKNLDASQLFSTVLNQLIHSIATDNTKSKNAVKVYKKHDLLYATFNETVKLYESLIDFTTGTETELIIGTNIREVNISELFIELRKLIENEAVAREQGDNLLQQYINTERSAREQADNTKANKSDVLTIEEIQASTDLSGKIASADIPLLYTMKCYKKNTTESTNSVTFRTTGRSLGLLFVLQNLLGCGLYVVYVDNYSNITYQEIYSHGTSLSVNGSEISISMSSWSEAVMLNIGGGWE